LIVDTTVTVEITAIHDSLVAVFVTVFSCVLEELEQLEALKTVTEFIDC
jgi:hypothetical protein